MNICYIACALDCKLDFVPDKSDYVIGADRGYLNLIKNGIKPDLVIGDFDSYADKIECKNVIKYPVKKDFTDSALAAEHAISMGYRKIIVYGAIGGHLDHTLANVALLANLVKRGIEIAFVDGEDIIFALHSSKAVFSEQSKGRISVFSFDNEAQGVCEKGLLYELENTVLQNSIPLGVSNEFIGKKAEISVKQGTLLIHTARENYFKHLTKK